MILEHFCKLFGVYVVVGVRKDILKLRGNLAPPYNKENTIGLTCFMFSVVGEHHYRAGFSGY